MRRAKLSLHFTCSYLCFWTGIVAVEPEWFPVFCPSYVTLSKPLDDPPPDYDDVKQQVHIHVGWFS